MDKERFRSTLKPSIGQTVTPTCQSCHMFGKAFLLAIYRRIKIHTGWVK